MVKPLMGVDPTTAITGRTGGTGRKARIINAGCN